MKIHLPSLDELEDVVDRFTPYGLTTTRRTRAFEVGTNPYR
jgi:hypothetical protein